MCINFTECIVLESKKNIYFLQKNPLSTAN